MRTLLLIVLVIIPLALVGWIVFHGLSGAPDRGEAEVVAETGGAVGQGATGTAAGGNKQASADTVADRRLQALLDLPLVGAKLDGEVTLYDNDGLFEYINGAAPIFIERHFRRLAAVDLVTADEGELTCDIYDMQTAENAADIYAKERPQSATAAEVGDEGHAGSMALIFRSGPFYVKLTAFDAAAEALLPKLAALLVERMS